MKTSTRFFMFTAFLALAFLIPNKTFSQAFDGDMDEKIHAGYLNVDGHSGVEMECVEGANDYLSYGFFARVLLGNDVEKKNMGWADIGSAIYFHWDELLKLTSKLDIHTGFQLSWQSGWITGGMRYNFSERWGVYARIQKGLFDVIHSKDFDYPYNGRKLGFSVGLTFSLQ